jgi:hypothetical protein
MLHFLLPLSVIYALPQQPTQRIQNPQFSTMAKFAGTSYCTRIFETKRFECAWSCSGEVGASQFVESNYDGLTTGAGLVLLNQPLKTIIVSFRGTDAAQDVIIDLKFWKSAADWRYKLQDFLPPSLLPTDLRIHAGFEIQYVRLRDRLLNATLGLANRYPDYQIAFTGHSLGGALATLASVDFHDRYGFGDRISLYTYGAPRVGDEKWARYVNSLPYASRMYRIQRKGDPVVHLPPLFTGYEHSLQQFQVLDDRSVIRCQNKDNTGESPSCMNDWFSLWPSKHSDYFEGTRC